MPCYIQTVGGEIPNIIKYFGGLTAPKALRGHTATNWKLADIRGRLQCKDEARTYWNRLIEGDVIRFTRTICGGSPLHIIVIKPQAASPSQTANESGK
jgi:hypothetical protein